MAEAKEILERIGYTESAAEYARRNMGEKEWNDYGVYKQEELYKMPLQAVSVLKAEQAYVVLQYLFAVMDRDDIEKAFRFTWRNNISGRRLFRLTGLVRMVSIMYFSKDRERGDPAARLNILDLVLANAFSTGSLVNYWVQENRKESSLTVRGLMKSELVADAVSILMAHLPDEYFTAPAPAHPYEAATYFPLAVADIGAGIGDRIRVTAAGTEIMRIGEGGRYAIADAFQDALDRTPIEYLTRTRFSFHHDPRVPRWIEEVFDVIVFAPPTADQELTYLRETMLRAIIDRVGFSFEDHVTGTFVNLRSFVQSVLDAGAEILEDDEELDIPQFVVEFAATTSIKRT